MKEPADSKQGVTRRFFFKGAGSGALAAATGASAPPTHTSEEIARIIDDYTKAFEACQDAQSGMDPYIWNRKPEADRRPHLNIEQWAAPFEQAAGRVRQALPKFEDLSRKLESALGKDGIVFPDDNWLFNAVDNGVLRPEGVRRAFNFRKKQLTDGLHLFERSFPDIRKTNYAHKVAYENLEQSIRVLNPDRHIEDLIRLAADKAPEGTKWWEHFSEPHHAQQAAHQVIEDQKLQSYTRNEEAKRRIEQQEHEETQALRRERKANLKEAAGILGDFFGRPSSVSHGRVYIDIAAPSDALYAALRRVVTYRNDERAFPAMNKLIVAKLAGGADAPIDVRVPPAGYALRLPEKIVDRLADIVTGNAKFPSLAQEPNDADDVIAHYRAKTKQAEMAAKHGNALIEDLQQLRTLASSKLLHVSESSRSR